MIIWLQSYFKHEQLSSGYHFVVNQVLQREGIFRCQFLTVNSLYGKVAQRKMAKSGKTELQVYELSPEGKDRIISGLQYLIEVHKPTVIACQDLYTLWAITDDDTTTLPKCRGSTYWFRGIPVVVFAPMSQYNVQIVSHGPWVLTHDVQKLKRRSERNPINEPDFIYKTITSIDVLREVRELARNAEFISTDTETHRDFITCVGFTLLAGNQCLSFVVPFFDPTKQDGCFWERAEDEAMAWILVREILENPVPKILQNGATYDAAWFLIYRIVPEEFLIDTMHLMHSIWAEAPKRLDFICSLFLDSYAFWKEDSKGVTKAKSSIDVTQEALDKYWRYCGLDCHNTLLAARVLVQFVASQPWALTNYRREFGLQMGLGVNMTMRGMLVDRERQIAKEMANETAKAKALQDVRAVADDPGYNPNSSDQYAQLLYDVLGAEPVKSRGKKNTERSTDKTVLKLLAAQHPLLNTVIKAHTATKEPANNISKYGRFMLRENNEGKKVWNGLRLSSSGRFWFTISFAGTETTRAASNEHPYRCGTNAQNIPEQFRDMMVADEGYVFFECDYSQSDAFFVAAESEDVEYIKTMEGVIGGLDSHLKHAAFFTRKSYDELLDRYKAKDPWVAKKPGGIRDLFKRVVHGANFLMQGYTLVQTIGITNINAIAEALGMKGGFDGMKSMAAFAQAQLDRYSCELYPDLGKWQKAFPYQIAAAGSMWTNPFGFTRIFFGDILRDHKIQREAVANVGQSGTGGNINRALLEMRFEAKLDNEDCLIMFQGHDSLLFMIKVDRLHEYAPKILTIMQRPVTIKGWTFYVPVEANVGFSWGTGMFPYDPKQTPDDWLKNDLKVQQKYSKLAS